jgi:hypothetical protein
MARVNMPRKIRAKKGTAIERTTDIKILTTLKLETQE